MASRSSLFNIVVIRFQGKDAADQALSQVKARRKELGYKILDGVVRQCTEKGEASYHETDDLSTSRGADLGLTGGPAGRSLTSRTAPCPTLS